MAIKIYRDARNKVNNNKEIKNTSTLIERVKFFDDRRSEKKKYLNKRISIFTYSYYTVCIIEVEGFKIC